MEESIDQLSSNKKTYSEIFEEQFPYFLSIGMSPKEYWDDDPTLVRAYAKAFTLKRRRENFDAWLMGRYNYEALTVVIGNALRRKGDRPIEYAERPYFLDDKERQEYENQKAIEKANRLFGYMNRKIKIQKENEKDKEAKDG